MVEANNIIEQFHQLEIKQNMNTVDGRVHQRCWYRQIKLSTVHRIVIKMGQSRRTKINYQL